MKYLYPLASLMWSILHTEIHGGAEQAEEVEVGEEAEALLAGSHFDDVIARRESSKRANSAKSSR